jgi:Fic family protein
MDPNKPYNELPLLPPDTNLEVTAILKQVIKSTRALGELKGAGKNIPNQAVLINAIALQEAKESSEIESIFTTHDELFKAFDQEKATDPHTKEVLRYQEALWHGHNALKAKPFLTTNLFVELVRIIKQNQAGIRNTPGTKISRDDGQVIYTPPEGEAIIRDLLKNLEDYIHEDSEVDPLIKLAVIHYQFEAIHPFSDGNGRTGRIINILYLIQQGLIDLPVLYLSKYIIENKNNYYRSLREVTETGNWYQWIMYILVGVEKMAIYTKEKIDRIYQLKLAMGEKLRSESSFFTMELLEVIFERPYCRIQHLEEAGIAKRKTASEYLYHMEKIGLMRAQKVGREMLFINDAFLNILKA